MFFFSFVCFGSFEGAAHAWASNEFEGEGALRVPVWPARFVLVLGTMLASFSYALMFVVEAGHAIGDLASMTLFQTMIWQLALCRIFGKTTTYVEV